jgi:hypothetical protein
LKTWIRSQAIAKKMACSAVTLSVATIISVVAVACLAIGFSTDNWYEIRVDKNKTKLYLETHGMLNEYDKDWRYYSRDEGLFRICFAEKKPKEGKFIFETIIQFVTQM